MHEKPDNIMKKIPLNNSTISRSIDKMANDVKRQLINILQCSEFSIQVDESTVVDNQCLMMVYVRYFSKELRPCEEMLFIEKLPLDSRGAAIFHTLKSFLFEHNIPLIDCGDDVQEELIELQNDNDAIIRYRCNGKEGLWYYQSILNSYPSLWKHLKLLLLAFPTLYLVESGFYHVGTLLSHKRIVLDVTQRGNLRLKLTSLKPNVSALAASHQTHGSR
ncbi:Hypothetical predicted protein [Octopus vulgaris]|uniref:SCAN domain-containing protein 3-like n=1 Tax=Octopus vulgaris TaxID=6645 RepID=A0AA36AHB7_OCTVU|nr:Hypothetical predicted protein [Octopus vulgaris]